MRHCLRYIRDPDENCWSLRDPENLPHATFSAWAITEDDDLSEIPDNLYDGRAYFVVTARALFMVHGSGRPLMLGL